VIESCASRYFLDYVTIKIRAKSFAKNSVAQASSLWGNRASCPVQG
jgi:hypothetical protein